MNNCRGKRAEIGVYDDALEFDCKYIINKSHKEDDITIIDDCSIISMSIMEEDDV